MRLTKAVLLFALAYVLLMSTAAADEETVVYRGHPKPSEAQRPLFEFLRVEDAWKELGDAPGCRVGVFVQV